MLGKRQKDFKCNLRFSSYHIAVFNQKVMKLFENFSRFRKICGVRMIPLAVVLLICLLSVFARKLVPELSIFHQLYRLKENNVGMIQQ